MQLVSLECPDWFARSYVKTVQPSRLFNKPFARYTAADETDLRAALKLANTAWRNIRKRDRMANDPEIWSKTTDTLRAWWRNSSIPDPLILLRIWSELDARGATL